MELSPQTGILLHYLNINNQYVSMLMLNHITRQYYIINMICEIISLILNVLFILPSGGVHEGAEQE